MTCVIRSLSFAAARPCRTALALAALLSLALAAPGLLTAQAPPPVPPSPAGSAPGVAAVLAPYRTPVIALVQPASASASSPGNAGSVPQDRPVVVFRFAPGEPDDPLDVRSLLVAVDGVDRTALFQTTVVTGAPATWQAWGPMAEPTKAAATLTAGVHRVVARICSTRGACATTEAPILVVPAPVTVGAGDPAPVATAPDTAKQHLIRRAASSVFGAVRKLVKP